MADFIERVGATRLGVWIIKHLVSPIQRTVYRTSDGRFMSRVGKERELLLLTTKGRRTSKDRTVPVFYLRDGERIVICNVRPETERINPWVINLRSYPIVQLQIGSEVAHYRARAANDDELAHFWPRLVALWPAFKSHYERGGRRSVFILEPISQLQTMVET